MHRLFLNFVGHWLSLPLHLRCANEVTAIFERITLCLVDGKNCCSWQSKVINNSSVMPSYGRLDYRHFNSCVLSTMSGLYIFPP